MGKRVSMDEIYVDMNARYTEHGYSMERRGTLDDLERLGLTLERAVGRRFRCYMDDLDDDGQPDDIMFDGVVVLDSEFGYLAEADPPVYFHRSDIGQLEDNKLSIEQIMDRLGEWTHVPRDQAAGAKIVYFLKEQLKLSDAESEFRIAILLADELLLLRRMREAESVFKRTVDCYPEYSEAWRSFAHLFKVSGDFDRAAELMDEAVRIALQDGEFVIMMYCERARIARYACDWKALSATIQALVEYESKPGARDYVYECDFVSGIPADAMDEALVERLIARCEHTPAH